MLNIEAISGSLIHKVVIINYKHIEIVYFQMGLY